MGFFEHLEELRGALLRSFIGLGIGMLIAIFFTGDIIDYLRTPYGDDELVILDPTGSIVIYFRVALMSGAILAIPYITYQLFRFIAPGLKPAERRWVLSAIPVTTFFFLLGIAFAWFIMIPSAFAFLRDFQGDTFRADWTAQNYFSFLTALLFWMGVAFEMPVIFYVLARLGLVGPQSLVKNWRLAVVAITIVAALITPTVDPFNMLLVMLPLLGLYLLSILFVGIGVRGSQRNLMLSQPK